MSIRFDLIDLQLFLHVAENTNITQGAARANMTLASASERIRNMESALGVPLLERKRRGVGLTPAGSALVHHARIVARQLENMRGELGDYAKGLRGHVRLLANTVAIAELLPDALAMFLATHPNIDVELEDRASPEIVRSIAEGRGDIGVVTDVIDNTEEFETFPMGAIRLVVVAPHGHPLASRRKIAFREILSYDAVGLPAGSALQNFIDHHAALAGRRLKVRIRLGGFDSICRIVESGIGFAVLPETAARRCRQSMAVRVISLTDKWALRRHVICVRSFAALPAHAKRLVECMQQKRS
jgi:DNA-binding transcriptional LysR family regulator